MKTILLFSLFLSLVLSSVVSQAQEDRCSVAGLYPVAGSGRITYNFNSGWRFFLGDAAGAESVAFDDSHWDVVSVPHTSRLEAEGASGGRNYLGISWYRKTFVVPQDLEGKDLVLHFEGIMGKQKIYVNGQLAVSHLGGYLPIRVHLSDFGVRPSDRCVVAVCADNSRDSSFPPGKKQEQLDFCYHGGMYRDVWLLGLSPVHISDAIESNIVAGGGVFLHYDNVSEAKADVCVDVDVQNVSASTSAVVVSAVVRDSNGMVVLKSKKNLSVKANDRSVASMRQTLKNPHLWSPDDPYLYEVELSVCSKDGRRLDGGIVRMGVRHVEFRGQDGFWLNGKPFRQLVGGNRHQDFAIVGNALPNSQQWRDALRLKQAGMNVVRAAHYPQDDSFMDACDELGLFVIVPTPGWQYWNKDPQFAERVYQNTRDIVRRDRNHPSVLLWEPILNETRYPEDFALKSLQITRDEFPYPGRPLSAADMNSAGVKDNYDVLYGWPTDIGKEGTPTDKCIFTREFGEIVDDWYAHNCINRAFRGWGEVPMLDAALSLADSYATMFHGQRQFVGGCQWHPFDHQRGYHPEPYVGGIYDAFRQKKTAFWMFRSQIAPALSEPMVFIANEMTPYSPENVVVFSNCDSVRLTFLEGGVSRTLPVVSDDNDMPCKPLVFEGMWNFMSSREQSYFNRKWQNVLLLAEGFVGGKVVTSQKRMPARRSTRLRLYADTMGRNLVADGSDFVVVVAEVTDDNGNVRRLAIDDIQFEVVGEGSIITSDRARTNPRHVEWGSAPILVKASQTAGDVKIVARPLSMGTHSPRPDTLVIRSVAPSLPLCNGIAVVGAKTVCPVPQSGNAEAAPSISEAEVSRLLREVEEQQKEFGIGK